MRALEPYHPLLCGQRDGTIPKAVQNAVVLGCFAVPSWTITSAICNTVRDMNTDRKKGIR